MHDASYVYDLWGMMGRGVAGGDGFMGLGVGDIGDDWNGIGDVIGWSEQVHNYCIMKYFK